MDTRKQGEKADRIGKAALPSPPSAFRYGKEHAAILYPQRHAVQRLDFPGPSKFP
jgi:hypothetical protein